MSFQISYRLEGMAAIKRRLKGMKRAELRPLADAIGGALEDSARERLGETNRAPDGTPWPQSARARALGGPTQYDRGRLAGSLTSRTHAGGGSLAVGSPLIYAAMRQFGGTIRPKTPGGLLFFRTLDRSSGKPILIAAKEVTQPARPYLGISSEDEREIGGLTEDYFNALLGGAP